jgi:hypothetical protein
MEAWGSGRVLAAQAGLRRRRSSSSSDGSEGGGAQSEEEPLFAERGAGAWDPSEIRRGAWHGEVRPTPFRRLSRVSTPCASAIRSYDLTFVPRRRPAGLRLLF